MSKGLFHLAGLTGAIIGGPSNSGSRKDGKICTAQAGECRYNRKYYTLGMRDAKSWSMPSADNTCSKRCPYLSENPRDMGDEDERRERAGQILKALK